MKILVIEDNTDIAANIVDYFEDKGHIVDYAADGITGLHFAVTNDFDVIILDLMLPGMDGLDVCKKLRKEAEKTTPVLMLTARDRLEQKLKGFEYGADDYMTKPIDFSELEARCRAVLRRKGDSVQTNISHGNVSFDPVAATLSVGKKHVTLRTRELRLLELLISSPGQVFSKSKLVDRLFSYDQSVTENAIEVYIARLRRHLVGADISITTIRGMGYKLEKSIIL